MLRKSLLIAVLGFLAPSPVFAEMLWSSFSLSYLKGSEYELGDSTRRVLTVEHASGHSWGDNFFFYDHLVSDNGVAGNYFELGPRLSIGKLLDNDLSVGPLSDFFIATTWEGGDVGGTSFDNFLVGVGTNISIPGFKYFTMNLYSANNDLADNDEQITFTWAVPFGSGSIEFLYDGFLDYSTSSDTAEAEMNFTSQLKWNAGKLMGLKSPLYLGIEYAYWTNKFGVDGVDEKNPCLLLKWHF